MATGTAPRGAPVSTASDGSGAGSVSTAPAKRASAHRRTSSLTNLPFVECVSETTPRPRGGHNDEPAAVAGRHAGVADRSHRAVTRDEPVEPDVLGAVGGHDRGVQPREALRGEHAAAVERGAVALETRPRQQVVDRRNQAARGPVDRRELPTRLPARVADHEALVAQHDVRQRNPARDRVVGPEARLRHAERHEQPLAHEDVERRTRRGLDDQARDRERGVVVRVAGSRIEQATRVGRARRSAGSRRRTDGRRRSRPGG